MLGFFRKHVSNTLYKITQLWGRICTKTTKDSINNTIQADLNEKFGIIWYNFNLNCRRTYLNAYICISKAMNFNIYLYLFNKGRCIILIHLPSFKKKNEHRSLLLDLLKSYFHLKYYYFVTNTTLMLILS